VNDIAPAGHVFICGACGKKSQTAYGFLPDSGSDYMPDGSRVADPGWDESCMLNAVLVSLQELNDWQ
jgi:hypothetical protein